MSVEEMINLLTNHAVADRVFGGTRYDAIIVALRAGQTMANHLDKCINQYNPSKINYEDTLPVLIAWDAATKEDV